MKNETKPLPPAELQKDEHLYTALTTIDGYSPVNPLYSMENLVTMYMNMKMKQKIRIQKEGELMAAHDDAISSEHAFHDAILQAKNQVRAQFGEDSNELQSLGLKKKSERKQPKRKPKSVE
ncbi:MAG: hypothetical protein LBV41_11765 [Cytophagaceae bacterium]|nr:hypothetical protein [Cytophagaceae bacterium]